MEIHISREIKDQLRLWFSQAEDEEICGILTGTETHINDAILCRNVAENPHRFFEIDPAQLIKAERSARDGGPAIIGYFHSHPEGQAYPSPTDAQMAAPDDRIWLIIGASEMKAWRATENGALYSRFSAINLDC